MKQSMSKAALAAAAAFLAFASFAFAEEKGPQPGNRVEDVLKDGFIRVWMSAGPFPAGIPGGIIGHLMQDKTMITDKDYLTEQGGEAAIEPYLGMKHTVGGARSWRPFKSGTPMLDVGEGTKKTEGIIYAAAYIDSDSDRTLYLDSYSFMGAYIWFNHREAAKSPPGELGQTGRLTLLLNVKKGRNLLLIKYAGADIVAVSKTFNIGEQVIRNVVKGYNLYLSEGSGFSFVCHFGGVHPIENSGVSLVSIIKPTGHFRGDIKDLKEEIGVIVTNGSNEPRRDINLELAVKGAKEKDKTSLAYLAPGEFKDVSLAFPLRGFKPGDKASLTLTATQGGSKLIVPVVAEALGGRPKANEAIYFVPGFHADPVWIEDQRDYGVSLLGSMKQNLMLARADKDYGVYLSELSYLKPYYDAYPQDREYLKRLIKEGRVGTGGSYNQPVEKMIGPEGLVRNVLYGKLYHEQILGDAPRVYNGWDIFGHIAQLSQIMAKSRNDGIMWSKGIYGFHPIFWHISPDGTRLLHKRFAYSSNHSGPADLTRRVYSQFQELKSYGLDSDIRLDAGDFKPPTAWLLGETGKLLEYNPKIVVTGQGGNRFFKDVLRQEKDKNLTLPVTARDMTYYHQGTGLSRVDLKIANRLAENALASAEKFGAVANYLGARYPDAAIDKGWRQLLFGQHHDAITGTINDRSFLDLMAGYREALELADEALYGALDYIGGFVKTKNDRLPSGYVPVAVFNPLNWDRRDVVRAKLHFPTPLKGFAIVDEKGEAVPFETEHQTLGGDGGIVSAEILFVADGVPSIGYRLYYAVPRESDDPALKVAADDALEIENEFFRIRVDPKRGGGIVSLIDRKENRELIESKERVGNEVVALPEKEDRSEPPWELWTLGDKFFSADYPATVARMSGPVAARLLVRGGMKDSSRVQEIVLYKGVKRIDFTTSIEDYKGKQDLLAVTFPTNLKGSVPVFEERYASVVKKKSKSYLDIRTAQPNNYSGTGARCAHQWMDYNYSGVVDLPGGKKQALGMMAFILPYDAKVEGAATELVEAFIRKGISSTPFQHDLEKERVAKLSSMDRTILFHHDDDLPYGTSFRIAFGDETKNEYVAKIMKQLTQEQREAFKKRAASEGFAALFVMDADLKDGWPAIPVLVLDGKDGASLAKGVSALAKDFDADARMDLTFATDLSNAPGELDDYGIAVLNRGNLLNSVESDGSIAIYLYHLARFFHRLDWEFTPEHKTHVFTYALYPHKGSWVQAKTYKVGWEYNNPLIAKTLSVHGGPFGGSKSFLSFDSDRLVVTAMKPVGNPTAAHLVNELDSRKGIAVRFYEATGYPGSAQVRFMDGMSAAWSANLLEEKQKPLGVRAGAARIEYPGFSIETVGFSASRSVTGGEKKQLATEREPAQPVPVRFWDHNAGDAPIGYTPVNITLHGELKTRIHIGQGGVSMNEIVAAVTNDYQKRRVKGVARIETPPEWKAVPQSFAYDLGPGEFMEKKVSIAFTTDRRDGVVRALIDHDGQTFMDTMEVGENELIMSAEKQDDRIVVTVKNPTGTDIDGELQLISPVESWSSREVGTMSLMTVTPRAQDVTIRGGETKTYTFKIFARPNVLEPRESVWTVVKLMYNGHFDYKEVRWAAGAVHEGEAN